MQESAQTWEAEAQENLQHMDQLKSLLEESAFWQSQSAQPSTADTDGSNPDHQRAPDGRRCCIHSFNLKVLGPTMIIGPLQCCV